MTIDTGEWECIDLKADAGACDSVMPRKGPCEMTNIDSPVQSDRGLQYEVANAEIPPCLGEQRLEVWTEGAWTPKAVAIQHDGAHKPIFVLEQARGHAILVAFWQDIWRIGRHRDRRDNTIGSSRKPLRAPSVGAQCK